MNNAWTRREQLKWACRLGTSGNLITRHEPARSKREPSVAASAVSQHLARRRRHRIDAKSFGVVDPDHACFLELFRGLEAVCESCPHLTNTTLVQRPPVNTYTRQRPHLPTPHPSSTGASAKPSSLLLPDASRADPVAPPSSPRCLSSPPSRRNSKARPGDVVDESRG